jgi:hypothetical protein
MGMLAVVGIFVEWPAPVPDPHFNLQSALNDVDEEFASGQGIVGANTMFAWYEKSEEFARKCKNVVVLGALLGLCVVQCVSVRVGWSKLKIRYLFSWCGAVAGGLAVAIFLPDDPPDPVYGASFRSVETFAKMAYVLVVATVLELVILAVNFVRHFRIYRSIIAWSVFILAVLAVSLSLSLRFLRQSDLHLERSNATNNQLILLRWMPNLEWMDISNTRVSDDGLQYLEGHRLRYLNLSSTQVTDAGIAHLTKLASLHSLDLSHTHISDRGLSSLKDIPGLASVNLTDTQVTDIGLVDLAMVPQLEWLDLVNTRVSDAGMKDIRQMNRLRYLNLSSTKISDAGLSELKALTTLRDLLLLEVNVSPEALRELSAALPNCFIMTDYGVL